MDLDDDELLATRISRRYIKKELVKKNYIKKDVIRDLVEQYKQSPLVNGPYVIKKLKELSGE